MATSLGRYQEFLIDASGNAISGGTVEIRRQGATVISGSGTSGFTATVNSRGGILNTNIVQVRRAGAVVSSSGGSSTFTAGSVTETTMTLSGHSGTMTLADEDRISPTTSLPTLYNDIKGAETKTNPLTSASDGEVTAWMAGGFYDRLVTNGASTKWSEDVYVPANPLGWINVKEGPYYAKGDGVTDDAPAIQMALDSLPDTGAMGGKLIFPPGDYYIASALTSTRQCIEIEGSGASGTGNIPDGGSALISNQPIVMLTVGDGASSLWGGPVIRNISFRDSSAGANTVLGALQLKRVNNFRFEGLNFSDITVGYAIKFDGTGDWVQYGNVIDMRLVNCKYGVTCTGNISAVNFWGGYLSGSTIAGGIGIELTSLASTCRIDGTAIQDFVTCVKINGAEHTYISGRFETVSGGPANTAIDILTGSTHTKIIGNTFANFATGMAVNIQAGADGTIISGNTYNTATDTVTDNGTSSIIERSDGNAMQHLFKYRRVGSTYDTAGFIQRNEPGIEQIMGLRTGLNTGMLLKDASVDGGLWLTADGANRACVGGGLAGDIAAPGTSLYANNTSSSHIKFADGAIYFYGNTGLTSGNAFTPTLVGTISSTQQLGTALGLGTRTNITVNGNDEIVTLPVTSSFFSVTSTAGGGELEGIDSAAADGRLILLRNTTGGNININHNQAIVGAVHPTYTSTETTVVWANATGIWFLHDTTLAAWFQVLSTEDLA